MKTIWKCLALIAVLIAVGCVDPSTSKSSGKSESGKKLETVSTETTVAEVFRKPNPGVAADDPRIIEAKKSSDAIAQSLDTIHARLVNLRKSYEDKAVNETDLRRVVEKLIPLAISARKDCDTIHRAALDLRQELKFARSGYNSAAELYRLRAASYADADLRKITYAMADEFERLASDVPRRTALLGDFLVQLDAMKVFLSDTERCLHETEAALTILTAGPDSITASAQSKAFRKQLETFIAVIEKYQDQFLRPPLAPVIIEANEVLPAPKPVGVNEGAKLIPSTPIAPQAKQLPAARESVDTDSKVAVETPKLLTDRTPEPLFRTTDWKGPPLIPLVEKAVASPEVKKTVLKSPFPTSGTAAPIVSRSIGTSIPATIYFCQRCQTWHPLPDPRR